MSARRIGRGWGVVIVCDYEGCTCRYQSACIIVKYNRAAAAVDGWIRGLFRGSGVRDVCPEHAPIEREKRTAFDKERRERKAARNAKLAPVAVAAPA